MTIPRRIGEAAFAHLEELDIQVGRDFVCEKMRLGMPRQPSFEADQLCIICFVPALIRNAILSCFPHYMAWVEVVCKRPQWHYDMIEDEERETVTATMSLQKCQPCFDRESMKLLFEFLFVDEKYIKPVDMIVRHVWPRKGNTSPMRLSIDRPEPVDKIVKKVKGYRSRVLPS